MKENHFQLLILSPQEGVQTPLFKQTWGIKMNCPHRKTWTDIFVFGYLLAVLFSFCFSVEHGTALWGFPGWHMGLLTQMMFVWIYYILSRWGECTKKIMWAAFACTVLVMGIAICNRYCFDPLGVFREMEQGTWNREHLLSTIGNQNWYCGFISVASAGCFYFCYVGEGAAKAAGWFGALITFWTVMTQGSDSGYLIPLAMAAVLFVDALGSRRRLLRFCMTLICCPAAALIGVQVIRLRGLMLVEDGFLRGILFWTGWKVCFFLLFGFILILYFREKKGRKDFLQSGRIKKVMLVLCSILCVVCGMIFLLCQVSDTVWSAFGEKSFLRLADQWGNDRGALWRLSREYFMQCPWYRKLFGAGPDCFYHALYSRYAVNDIIHPTGQWETAVYANAHNEWLNMLINQGILGVTCYVGMFAVSFCRLWKVRDRKKEAYWGLLAIAGYCVHATVSFQQTVSTPLLFAVLGISESVLRRKETGSENCIV